MEPNSNLAWPNLTRYKHQNFDIPAPQENEKRVVLMGDLITEQWSKFIQAALKIDLISTEVLEGRLLLRC